MTPTSVLMLLMPKTLAARMVLAIGAAALPPLIVASTLGLMLITLVSGAETDFDEASTIARRLSDLRLEIEHENSLVGRIPAELDLAVVKRQAGQLTATGGRIDDAIGLLTSNARIVTRDVAMEIGVLRQQRSRIVDEIVAAATSFSQTAALELLNGPFEESSATLLLLLDAVGSRVDSVVQIARTNLQTSTQVAWKLTPAALLGVLCTIALAGWTSRRGFVQPILRLREYAQNIGASSALDLRLDHASLERRDEIGALARAFDAMVRELADARRMLIARSEDEIARQAERLQAAITNMTQGLCMTDNDQRLVICNRRYAEMYALPDELTKPGTDMTRILMHQVAQGLLGPGEKALGMGRDIGTAVIELNDGRIIGLVRRPMPEGGEVATHEDITELRKSEARVAHMAYHDALTGLANRALLRVRLNKALAEAQAAQRQIAVICLDLNRFKEVNDRLGHSIGDSLLKTVADRLRNCVAETDTVARLGGDEFVVVNTGSDARRAADLATRILQGLSAPYDLGGHKVDISASGGIALFPSDASDSERLFRNADLALYEAKAAGPTYKFYTEDMGTRAQIRHELEHDLRSALLNGELTLEYQPLVSLKDDGICCCEALLRWRHPQRGRISPADFIPLAESSGIIVPIGQWVLREACMQAATWPAKIGVAVNLSVAQFKSADLVQSVTWALAHSGLAPERLELEITESILLDDSDGALRKLRQLRNLGVKIALDDFGTGYSSLAYLQTFSFDKIKIDRCFVSGLSHGNPISRAIMRAVADLGASLGIATTAEGVETAEQLDIVRAEGCTEVQGYLFSPPKSAKEIAALVASDHRRPRRKDKSSLPAVVDRSGQQVVVAAEHEERRLQALQSYGVLDTPPEESFDRITRLARLALNAPMAMISLVDRDRQWFKSKQGVEVDETPRSFSFCTHTVREEAPLIVGDATRDPRFCNSPLVIGSPNVRAYAGVPLRTPEGYNIGALCVNDVKAREITHEQIAVLQDLGKLVVDELELRRLATIDGLTSALTVRAFHAQAARAIQQAHALNRPLSCVMLDVDHFKSVNDTYGHAVGDKVLSDVARVCASGIRSSDYLGRLGGEEFAILLPGAESGVAVEIAESLRAAVARQDIQHSDDTIRVTASFGVAALGDGAADIKELLARADAVLYRAKRTGRNRVELAGSKAEITLEANVA